MEKNILETMSLDDRPKEGFFSLLVGHVLAPLRRKIGKPAEQNVEQQEGDTLSTELRMNKDTDRAHVPAGSQSDCRPTDQLSVDPAQRRKHPARIGGFEPASVKTSTLPVRFGQLKARFPLPLRKRGERPELDAHPFHPHPPTAGLKFGVCVNFPSLSSSCLLLAYFTTTPRPLATGSPSKLAPRPAMEVGMRLIVQVIRLVSGS